MRTARIGQRSAPVFVATLAGLGAMLVNASPSSPTTLEQQADAEFAKAGVAMRVRLEREASGDSIGAQIAAREAELHRYRYLDLQRELKRQLRQAQVSPSVAAARDPFIPDGSFLANVPPTASRPAPRAWIDRDAGTESSYRSWDMYRPRVSLEGAGTQGAESSLVMRATPTATGMAQAKDMYATEFERRAPNDRRALTNDPQAPVFTADAPRRPFLVYRAGPSSSISRDSR